jgi:SAM-dependent methyltransferase
MGRSAAGNHAQEEFWSELGGDAWVDFQDHLDRQLSVVGAAALAALSPRTGESVLDVGCGCGATTLDLAAAVGPTGRVVGLDISAPMVDVAARRIGERGHHHASALTGDAQIVTADHIGGPVDAVYSRFGVMFFDDPVAAFANMRALTTASGRMAFVCWQDASRNRLFGDSARELAALFPGRPAPDPQAPGPLAFADANRVRAILDEAGWSQIDIAELVAPMQLFGTTDFDTALEASLRVGSAARMLQGADADTARTVHEAMRRVLHAQWTDDGAVVDSVTWVVTARNSAAGRGRRART